MRYSLLFAALVVVGAALSATDRSTVSTPVVVELFTSQGCSSCPPADRLLSRLGADELPDKIEVIPLSFHVDYWNYIGWTDPFSSKEWSERQRRYARVMQLDTIYTPQIVIQGSSQVVGSSSEKVLREVARARSRGVAVAIDIELAKPSPTALEAAFSARIDDSIPGHGLELIVVLFEKELVTPVSRGENAARTLTNDYVVRALRKGLEVTGGRGTSRSGSVVFDLDPEWQRANLGVVAFVQDPVGLGIYGAASAPAG